MPMEFEDFKVPAGKTISLKDYDSAWVPKWAKGKEIKNKKDWKEAASSILEKNRQKLVNMQDLLWASDSYSMIVQFAM